MITTSLRFLAVSFLATAGASAAITSVVNSGSFTNNFAPGTLVTVFGTGLPTNASAGATVGGAAAVISYASATQWAIAIPTTAPLGSTAISIGGSAPFNISLVQYAPAFFASTIDTTIIAGTHTDNSAITSGNPARPGETVYLFATGLGAVDANNQPAATPTVNIGGAPATVQSTTLVNNVGADFYQLNVQVPNTAANGTAGVTLSIGGVNGSNSPNLNLPIGGASASGAPTISGVINAATFQAGVVPNSWVAIQGTNLASGTDDWSKSITNGNLPTTLDGVTVTIGGQPAYVYYVSQTQINVLAPNIGAGPTTVTVKSPGGTATANSTAQIYGPGFFIWPGGYAVATHSDYSPAVADGTFPGKTTVAAKPGDVLIFWGTGFGPTTPAAPVGVAIPPTSYTVPGVTATIGGVNAKVDGVALSSGSAGLYQVVIEIPTSLADGDYSVVASVNGTSSPTAAKLTIKH